MHRWSRCIRSHPLAKGQALAVACTSYDGGVFFGLTADRDAIPDVEEFAVHIGEAIEELLPHQAGPVARIAKPRRARRTTASRPLQPTEPQPTEPQPTEPQPMETAAGGAAADGTAAGGAAVRIYIPVTLTTLRTGCQARSVTPAGGVVFGVTDDLRGEYPEADDEELEFLAMSDAARACLRLLAAAGPDEPPLRVRHLGRDAPSVTPTPELDRAAARVDGPIAWKQIASFHLDGAEAAEAVRAAAQVVDEADLGDDDAEFAVGSAEDLALAWYAPGEMSYLLVDLENAAGSDDPAAASD